MFITLAMESVIVISVASYLRFSGENFYWRAKRLGVVSAYLDILFHPRVTVKLPDFIFVPVHTVLIYHRDIMKEIISLWIYNSL